MNKNISSETEVFTEGFEAYLRKDRPFTHYMLDDFQNRGLIRQRIFEKAGVSTGYGYKILYGEKKTQNRDLILSLCLSAEMNLQKTQTALLLYNMPLLYSCHPRDEIVMEFISNNNYCISKINERLTEEGYAELSSKKCL